MVNVAWRFGLTSGSRRCASFRGCAGRGAGSQPRVTEAEPVIDYVRSMSSTGGVADERFDAMKQFVEHEIQSRGALTIQTESGFSSREPERRSPGCESKRSLLDILIVQGCDDRGQDEDQHRESIANLVMAGSIRA